MAYINVNGQWVPVEGRAERAALNSGINTVPKPSLKAAAPTVRTFNENNVTPKTAPANTPTYNIQEMLKAASYSNRFDGLGGATIKEAATAPATNVKSKADKPTEVNVVKKSSNYVSPYEAGQDRSKSEVIAIQKQLGVKADGKWGPKTQAAYEAYANRNAEVPARSASLDQLPVEGLAATAVPKEVGFLEGLSQFWERLFQDDRTPEQKAAEQQAVFDKVLNAVSDNTGLAAAQYGR